MRNLIVIGLLSSMLAACSDEPWNDEYFIKDLSDGHSELECTKAEANSIASKAIENKQSKYYRRFLDKGFSIYNPVYGKFDGVTQQRYNYKTILGYKKVEHMVFGGSYYEESIEVSLSKTCDVLDVVYFKGKIDYVH